MIIGVPKEIKANENRVAVTPAGTEFFKNQGHSVLIETNAGIGSAFTDEQYKKSGAEIVSKPEEIFQRAEMIMKVKEPLPKEYKLIREGQIVFTYFHFAASQELTQAMIRSKCVAIAYETVQNASNALPLLIPMSEVAGRMAIQEGARYLEKLHGGKGMLLGGVPGVEPASVVILGGGIVGMNAAKIAAGLGAKVSILDTNLDKLRYLDDVMPKNVITVMSNPANIRRAISEADLLVGAVLIPGAKAPKLVTRNMLKLMKKGSVIVDVAVDQGGCIETIKPTTHDDPVYEIDGVIHYGVANMPGGVPMTSTIALTNATLPYALQIAKLGFPKVASKKPDILKGVNIAYGKVTHEGVAEAFNLPYTSIQEIL
ncbi:alanine dehydrogenase [candidate division KSB1 bacterium]|nr:alanine dehydrogenase [candidate division KSB1 bacterium]NIR70412.1 alanine dehydrogenase [candidate division KSB1 bacterium]NIS25952.1 alanine dehydrogenase [candidate division KSB1 bacterium]NIT69975.1 alanine dehydrogenase [candidate division KSB1 bacterium]NIU26640.1 alanine dehydrogenase [candidate division KSB1 bacterium]